MQATKFARLAAIALAASVSSIAFADTATLSVSASVTATCKLTAMPPMSFSLDPTVNTAGTANSAVQYKCTNGTSAGAFSVGAVTAGGTGFSGTLANGANNLPYTITWANPSAFTGTGFGAGSTGNTVTLTGTVLAANYQNAVAGTYNGTVAVTIAP